MVSTKKNNNIKNLINKNKNINKLINFISFIRNYSYKTKIFKIISYIIIFILIFDKATLLFITYLFNKYIYKPSKKHEQFNNYSINNSNNNLAATIFEPSNNYIALLSKVYTHPELNFKSYTNVKIDPTKVLFEDNKFLPECCFYNSEYSSSKGCPCITGDQQNYLNTRGTNKSHTSFIQSNNSYKNLYFSPSLAFQGEKVPFKINDEKFITGYEPLSSDKQTEFNRLINMY